MQAYQPLEKCRFGHTDITQKECRNGNNAGRSFYVCEQCQLQTGKGFVKWADGGVNLNQAAIPANHVSARSDLEQLAAIEQRLALMGARLDEIHAAITALSGMHH